jgi:exosortase A
MTHIAVSRQRLGTHVLFGLVLFAYALTYLSTLKTLIGVWAGDGTFQYAFLIVPISLFLVWSRRHEVALLGFAPSPNGLLLVAAMSGLWLVGDLVGVLLVQHFAVVALLPALALAVYGRSVGRALLFPLLYLFFAFPWPVAGLTTLLQHITAEFSVRVLQLTGFTTVLRGVLIETPFGAWHVAEACSGIKFFIASLALGALYANLFYRSWRRRLVFMVFAFVVPIIANGFRVYFTVVIGEVFGVQYATGTDHLIFGWQFFGTVLLLLFLISWRWREAPPQEMPVSAHLAGAASAKIVPLGVSALLLSMSGPAIGWGLAALTPATRGAVTPVAPHAFGAWRLLLPQANPIGAHYRNPDFQFMGTYVDGERHVNMVQVRYDGRPGDGHKLFLTGNRPYNSGQWRRLGAVRLLHPAELHAVHQLQLSSGGQERLIWYWYEVGGHVVQGLAQVKLRQLLDGLRAAPLSTQVLILSTPLPSTGRDAVAVAADSLRTFMQAYMAAESGR